MVKRTVDGGLVESEEVLQVDRGVDQREWVVDEGEKVIDG